MLLLPSTVTVNEAVEVQRVLTDALRLETGPSVGIDASNLQRFDSAALAVLLRCERLAGQAGQSFEVRGLPAQLASLAKLYGIDSLLASAAIAGEAAPPGTETDRQAA